MWIVSDCGSVPPSVTIPTYNTRLTFAAVAKPDSDVMYTSYNQQGAYTNHHVEGRAPQRRAQPAHPHPARRAAVRPLPS